MKLSGQGRGDKKPFGVSDLCFKAASGCWVQSTSQKKGELRGHSSKMGVHGGTDWGKGRENECDH